MHCLSQHAGADSALLERFILQNEDIATELALAKDARRAASPASSAASGSCASNTSSASSSSGGGGGGAAARQQAAEDATLRHIYAACVRECLTGHANRDAILVRQPVALSKNTRFITGSAEESRLMAVVHAEAQTSLWQLGAGGCHVTHMMRDPLRIRMPLLLLPAEHIEKSPQQPPLPFALDFQSIFLSSQARMHSCELNLQGMHLPPSAGGPERRVRAPAPDRAGPGGILYHLQQRRQRSRRRQPAGGGRPGFCRPSAAAAVAARCTEASGRRFLVLLAAQATC